MTDRRLYPLKFAPIFQYRLWGGRALADYMEVTLPGDEPIGEAWILSDRTEFASPIANGPLAGQTFSALMQQRKADIMGRQASHFDRFPLLLKFLDVEKMLSVQVHPRDDQAELIPPGDMGKTEAWIVLEAQEAARIYAGLKPGTTAQDLSSLTAANADHYLPSFRPEPGQALLIEAGTVHSLGDGVLVFEVQENSDTTFRLFDWDHVDARTGQPRELLTNLPVGRQLVRLSLLPTSGTRFLTYDGSWQQRYAEDFTSSEKAKIVAALNAVFDASGFAPQQHWGDIIEDRGSQITLSALGQHAPLDAKKDWDPDFAKRRILKAKLAPLIPEFSVGMGGATSLDITRPGVDKAYGIAKLHEVLGIPIEDMLFVGDALFEGGNDYPAHRSGVDCIQVAGPSETVKVIETAIACCAGAIA